MSDLEEGIRKLVKRANISQNSEMKVKQIVWDFLISHSGTMLKVTELGIAEEDYIYSVLYIVLLRFAPVCDIKLSEICIRVWNNALSERQNLKMEKTRLMFFVLFSWEKGYLFWGFFLLFFFQFDGIFMRNLLCRSISVGIWREKEQKCAKKS